MGIIQNIKRREFNSTLIVVILVVFVFLAGLFLGRVWTIHKLVTDDNGDVQITKVLGLYTKSGSTEVEFTQFWDLWDKVKDKYVNQPVNDIDLFYGALEGLVSGLNDPYSVYFPPKKAEEFAKDLSGEFEGIGAEIGIKNSQLTIVAPLSGSPAEKAGLKPGDKVYAVDGEETYGITLDEAVSKIRGPEGTEVSLTISHDGLEEVEEVVVTRDKINVPTIAWQMEENNIAYLRISYFNETTWREFDKAVREILLDGPAGIVLDLRSNPGGFLDTSVAIASEWVDRGIIVKEKFSDTEEDEYRTYGAHRLSDIPTVVLIDEGTASGSEIVAGALQDHDSATIVGVKSYGKGSVQDFEMLPDGSALKLTVARWYTPNGTVIEEEGVMPDVLVEEMFVKVNEGEEGVYQDMGLEKALEILNSQI